MKMLQNLFNFYIDSSIHVALAACCLTAVTFLKLDIPVAVNTMAFIFFATITGYNFVKYAGVAKLHYQSLTRDLRAIQIFSLIIFILLVYETTQQSSAFLWTTVALGAVTFFYAVPFLPQNKNLRNLKTLKVFVIAFVWAGMAALLPAVEKLDLFSGVVILSFVQYFVFMLAVMIPFEIRDLTYDDVELGTLPQLVGVERCKYFAYAMLGIFVVLEFLIAGSDWTRVIPVLIVALVVALFVKRSAVNQGEYYASFWVESIPIFWLGIEFASNQFIA